MNDKELLELAAKAAGYQWRWEEEDRMAVFMFDRRWTYFDPLTDDGDALRLGVRLGLMVDLFECASDSVEASFYDGDYSTNCCEPVGEDKAAATRRAIVRVAAEIGRTME